MPLFVLPIVKGVHFQSFILLVASQALSWARCNSARAHQVCMSDVVITEGVFNAAGALILICAIFEASVETMLLFSVTELCSGRGTGRLARASDCSNFTGKALKALTSVVKSKLVVTLVPLTVRTVKALLSDSKNSSISRPVEERRLLMRHL